MRSKYKKWRTTWPIRADHEVDDELIDQVFSYLMYNEYPDDASESKKRIIRKKAKKFVILEGELFYRQAATKHKVWVHTN